MKTAKNIICFIMDRKVSRGALLQLPLARNNQKQNIDIDESVRDGYNWPGRLVIETSEDSSVNLPANDSTEQWMKARSDQAGGQQQQLCQIDIGNGCYVVGNTFKGQMLIHVRKYEKRDDGKLFPTKRGIALNLEKWKKLQYWCLENIDSALEQYRDSKSVDFMVHLGGNYHVSVKSGYPLVNIRRWFTPEDREELTPTKTGIALTFLQWDKLKSAMLLVEELLNGELDKVCFCEETHQNQEGALTCSNCDPNDFMNY